MNTWNINCQLEQEFSIIETYDLTNNNFLKNHIDFNKRQIIIVDKKISLLYSDFLDIFPDAVILKLQIEETQKNLQSIEKIINFFNHNNLSRREEVIAIGGGVLLDLVGFACSIYRRGIPYIKIPTTLLAYVDASIGTKVGINYLGKRNRLGSYYPPSKVLLDKKFFKTQEEKQIINGIGEILKLAIISNLKLFELIEQGNNIVSNSLQNSDEILFQSIDTMVNELQNNLYERNLKRPVDFGHTFSPMIEMKNLPSMLHGEAVMLDCFFSCCLSYYKNFITKQDLNRIYNCIRKYKLPTFHSDFADINLILMSLEETTLHRDGYQNIPLPKTLGKNIITNGVTSDDLKKTIEIFLEYENSINHRN